MSTLAENIANIREQLQGSTCKLVAVSKTKPVEMLKEAYDLGLKVFGENKAQEMATKHEALPTDIEWHMIGHLQTNKVKMIAPFVHTIHSVDSLKVLKEINKRAGQNDRTINCLLQIHIAEEESKFGFSEEEVHALLANETIAHFRHVRLQGLMGMATFTDDEGQIRREFQRLRQLFEKLKAEYALPNMEFTELSMGMSGDFPIALEEGSTMVRVGSSIFGARN